MTQSDRPFYKNPNRQQQPQQDNNPHSDQNNPNWPNEPAPTEPYDPAAHIYQGQQPYGQPDSQASFGNAPMPNDPNFGNHDYPPQPQGQNFYPSTPGHPGTYGDHPSGPPYQPAQTPASGQNPDHISSQTDGRYANPTEPSFGGGFYDNSHQQNSQSHLPPGNHENHGEAGWPGFEPTYAGNFQPQHDQSASPDYNTYDLSNYKPSGQNNQPGFGEAGYIPTENWNQGLHASHAPAGHPAFGPAGDLNIGPIAHNNASHNRDADEDYDDEYEEETGGKRGLIIAAALVSMIIVGGAFAYGYNILFSTSSKKTGTPVVNRSEEPARVQPADPGGRKFENTDSQLMDRIGNRGQAGNTAQEDAGGNRVRTVSTLVVGRDGRLIVENKDADQQPASQDRSQSAAASQVANDAPSGIPGMIIEGRNQQPDQRTNENQPAAPSQQAAVAVPPVSTPRVQQPTTDTDVQEEPSQPVVVRRRNSKFPPLPQRSGVDKPGVDLGPETPVPTTSEDEQFDSAPQSDLTQAAAGPAPNGYVAVLSTKRSRIDALTSFADLQQRYPNILGAKVPDVRRADLTSRGLGVMYRAVVGPPGSREVASQLCDRLKTVGYGNCWVSAY